MTAVSTVVQELIRHESGHYKKYTGIVFNKRHTNDLFYLEIRYLIWYMVIIIEGLSLLQSIPGIQ